MTEQQELQGRIRKEAGIDIVTCGECGIVMLSDKRVDKDYESCPRCSFLSDVADFPDYQTY